MNRRQWMLLLAALALIAGAGVVLNRVKTHQKLGQPGIRAVPIPGSVKMEVDLPETVLDYTSKRMPEDKVTADTLPKDTSFVQRLYTAPDGFRVSGNLVLMGTDRTSIHKPEFCLPGQGLQINEKSVVNLQIEGSSSYPLSVTKWVLSGTSRAEDGRPVPFRALYVFWFVADQETTVSHWQRLWWLARDLVQTGVLQRWAYVSYFAPVAPGQEEAAFERLKQLIAASVPQFQLPPKSAGAGAEAQPGPAPTKRVLTQGRSDPARPSRNPTGQEEPPRGVTGTKRWGMTPFHVCAFSAFLRLKKFCRKCANSQHRTAERGRSDEPEERIFHLRPSPPSADSPC